MVEFLKNKIGNETYNQIVEIINKEKNPFDLINSQILKDICGNNYNQTSNVLKCIYSSNKTPQSTTSTSTKASLNYL